MSNMEVETSGELFDVQELVGTVHAEFPTGVFSSNTHGPVDAFKFIKFLMLVFEKYGLKFAPPDSPNIPITVDRIVSIKVNHVNENGAHKVKFGVGPAKPWNAQHSRTGTYQTSAIFEPVTLETANYLDIGFLVPCMALAKDVRAGADTLSDAQDTETIATNIDVGFDPVTHLYSLTVRYQYITPTS